MKIADLFIETLRRMGKKIIEVYIYIYVCMCVYIYVYTYIYKYNIWRRPFVRLIILQDY